MTPWEKKQIAKEKEKVKDLCIDGLITDEGHHKTWYIERVLEALGFDIKEIRADVQRHGYDWEPGIAP